MSRETFTSKLAAALAVLASGGSLFTFARAWIGLANGTVAGSRCDSDPVASGTPTAFRPSSFVVERLTDRIGAGTRGDTSKDPVKTRRANVNKLFFHEALPMEIQLQAAALAVSVGAFDRVLTAWIDGTWVSQEDVDRLLAKDAKTREAKNAALFDAAVAKKAKKGKKDKVTV